MSVFSENDKDKILRDFQIQTDKQGLANKSDFVIYKKKKARDSRRTQYTAFKVVLRVKGCLIKLYSILVQIQLFIDKRFS